MFAIALLSVLAFSEPPPVETPVASATPLAVPHQDVCPCGCVHFKTCCKCRPARVKTLCCCTECDRGVACCVKTKRVKHRRVCYIEQRRCRAYPASGTSHGPAPTPILPH